MDQDEIDILEVKPERLGWYWVTLFQYEKEREEDPNYFMEWVEFKDDGEWDYFMYPKCYVCFIHKREEQ